MNRAELRLAVWAAEFTHCLREIKGGDAALRAELAAKSADRAVDALDLVCHEKNRPFSDLDQRCLMTWPDFLEGCLSGMLMDDDGTGVLATETGRSDKCVSPRVVHAGRFTRPSWATHVCWYNK